MDSTALCAVFALPGQAQRVVWFVGSAVPLHF